MKNKTSPWKKCIESLPTRILDDLYNTCITDMCSFENDTKQNDYKCFSFEQLTLKCYELTNSNQIYWRKYSDCRNY